MRLRGGLLLVLVCLFGLVGDSAPGRVVLAFLGDIMLGRGVAQAHSNGGWQDTFSPLIPQLCGVDFSLANLESPVCKNDQTTAIEKNGDGYILTAPEAGLEALRPLDLGIVSLANNHSLDCGTAGLTGTINALEKMGMRPLVDGGQPIFVDTRRGRFAFLAYNDVGRGIDIDKVIQKVADARRSAAIVIVSLHWGLEYQPGANESQRKQAQALADAGAALIWGHHPHVLQPPAWVWGKGQSRPTLVLYSLGNALFDQHAPPDTMRSAMIIIYFDDGGARQIFFYPFEIDPQRGRIMIARYHQKEIISKHFEIRNK